MAVKKAIKIGNEYVAEDDEVRIVLSYISGSSNYAAVSKYANQSILLGRISSISDDFDEDAVIQLDISEVHKSIVISIPYSYIKTINKVEVPTCL